MKNCFLSVVAVFFILQTGFSQWTNNPSGNTLICDVNGESALPKIVSTSNGGNYISWFDNRGGGYAVYLQKLDVLGNKIWAADGLLISSNPQNSSLVDYDLKCDNQDNAILVFTDMRSGSLNVFAYKISPNGDFLWGLNGIALSSTTDYQVNPKVAVTTDGSAVVTWIIAANPYKIALQKISASGTKLWGESPIIYQSASSENYNYPQPVASDNGNVIIIHSIVTGNFPAQNAKLAVQKFSANGVPLLGAGGVWVQNLGKVQNFTAPSVISDGNNGAIVSWYDDRNSDNIQNSFVQRINSSGTLLYPANGTEVTLLGTEHKFYPVSAVLNQTNEVVTFWLQKNSNQTITSIMGQKISQNGTRLWTDDGKVFLPATSNSISALNTVSADTFAYVMYNEGNISGMQNKIMVLNVSSSGLSIWNNPVTLSNPTQEKLRLVTAIDLFKVGKAVWMDKRLDDGGIYGQNINLDGSLGNNFVPVELIGFSASIIGSSVHLKWETASEKNNQGYTLERAEVSGGNPVDKWTGIAFIKGIGNSTSEISYSYIDENLDPGIYKYRLKQLDFDGSTSYSGEIEVELNSPNIFRLSQNYPNPFNPSTAINYDLPFDSRIVLKLYDVLGNEVATLIDQFQSSGYHSFVISLDRYSLNSGVYFYKLQAGNVSAIKKMIVLK